MAGKEKYSQEFKNKSKILYITFKQRPSLAEFQKQIFSKYSIKVSLQGLANWIKEFGWEEERSGIMHEAFQMAKAEMVKIHADDTVRHHRTLDAVEAKLLDDLLNRAKGRSMEALAQAVVAIRKQRLLELGHPTEHTKVDIPDNISDKDLNSFLKKNERWLEGFQNKLPSSIKKDEGNA